MDRLIILICVLVIVNLFLLSPTTMVLFMFFNVFGKKKPIPFETANLKNTEYGYVEDELKKQIIRAKHLPFEKVDIKSFDNLTLYARYFNLNSDKTAILVHGYKANGYNNFSLILQKFLEKGFNVLMIEQRAHGVSEGKFTTLGYNEQFDILSWIDYESEKQNIKEICVYGISMGATATGLASDKIKSPKVKCLILESGFTCFEEEMKGMFLKIPFKKLILKQTNAMTKKFLKADIKASTLTSLKNTKVPVLFLCSDQDKAVSSEFSKQNYLTCASKKNIINVENAMHTLCFMVGGELVQNQVFDFISSVS